MIIATHKSAPWVEVYASDDESHPADALRQWLNRRKAGMVPFSRGQELALALIIGMALAKRERMVTFQNEEIELIY